MLGKPTSRVAFHAMRGRCSARLGKVMQVNIDVVEVLKNVSIARPDASASMWYLSVQCIHSPASERRRYAKVQILVCSFKVSKLHEVAPCSCSKSLYALVDVHPDCVTEIAGRFSLYPTIETSCSDVCESRC